MEVDTVVKQAKAIGAAAAVGSVTATASGGGSSVFVSLHPLVIMNVAEHWTRVTAQLGKPVQVLGALIGKQKGRNLEIMNSFELVFHSIDGETIIDRDYYTLKEDQFKQVFSDLDFLGWYNTGESLSELDIKVHKQICSINESPIFLKLNPIARTSELPVSVYESVIDLVDKEAKMRFVELPYVLATEEAERIGVDHVARVTCVSEAGEASSAAEHLIAQHNAIKMLHSRIRLILEYIQDVEQGKVAKNHEILREAYSLCHRLPVLSTNKFREEFYNQCNDVALVAYLGALTKACSGMNHYVNKFNVIYDRQQMSRRMRGLLF
jgi:COP9 signalosome complex subunit 6